MQEGNAKQQIVEQIKGATNILVTVSSGPTVDELSAALGLTLMLNKMDKHATAVFSGQLPPAISFLEPDKTFENTVDSLRDFIIALDKDKADRLRYKVENDVVRVFITPYRTTITEKDLQFSQGDFNVELIVALGVEKREDLDTAIVAHGRILHDASVITINTKNEESSLGGVDWHDGNVSSLCEMLMSLSEALQPGLLDEQISTSLLTGIVAATERFSNSHTTPRVMTMAAQLMAAGANQQLIATKLEEGNALPVTSRDGSTYLKEGASSRVKQNEVTADDQSTQAAERPDGMLEVAHEPEQDQVPAAPAFPAGNNEASQPAYDVEKELADRLSAQMPAPADITNMHEAIAQETQLNVLNSSQGPALNLPSLPELPQPLSSHANDQDAPGNKIIRDSKPGWMSASDEPPSMGSPLSATTQQALDDAKRQEELNHKYSLLSHDSASGIPDSTPEEAPAAPASTSDFGLQFEEAPLPSLSAPAQEAASPESHAPTLAELEQQAHAAAAEHLASPPQSSSFDVDQARQAVDQALSGMPFPAADEPLQAVGAQEFGVINHDNNIPSGQVAMPGPMADDLPTPPPLPDFSALPPLPSGAPDASTSPFIDPGTTPADQIPAGPTASSADNSSQQGSNPGQFQIPGQ